MKGAGGGEDAVEGAAERLELPLRALFQRPLHLRHPRPDERVPGAEVVLQAERRRPRDRRGEREGDPRQLHGERVGIDAEEGAARHHPPDQVAVRQPRRIDLDPLAAQVRHDLRPQVGEPLAEGAPVLVRQREEALGDPLGGVEEEAAAPHRGIADAERQEVVRRAPLQHVRLPRRAGGVRPPGGGALAAGGHLAQRVSVRRLAGLERGADALRQHVGGQPARRGRGRRRLPLAAGVHQPRAAALVGHQPHLRERLEERDEAVHLQRPEVHPLAVDAREVVEGARQEGVGDGVLVEEAVARVLGRKEDQPVAGDAERRVAVVHQGEEAEQVVPQLGAVAQAVPGVDALGGGLPDAGERIQSVCGSAVRREEAARFGPGHLEDAGEEAEGGGVDGAERLLRLGREAAPAAAVHHPRRQPLEDVLQHAAAKLALQRGAVRPHARLGGRRRGAQAASWRRVRAGADGRVRGGILGRGAARRLGRWGRRSGRSRAERGSDPGMSVPRRRKSTGSRAPRPRPCGSRAGRTRFVFPVFDLAENKSGDASAMIGLLYSGNARRRGGAPPSARIRPRRVPVGSRPICFPRLRSLRKINPVKSRVCRLRQSGIGS